MILVGNVAERPHREFFGHAALLLCDNADSMRRGSNPYAVMSTRGSRRRNTQDHGVQRRDLERLTGNGMQYDTLLNPFSLNQESSQIVQRPAAGAARSTPVCSNCQLDEIIVHATAQWSNESQEWELANTFDRPAHCTHCNGPCEIIWLPLN
jgi:hypothetical protein